MVTDSITMTTKSPDTSQADWTTVSSQMTSYDAPSQSDSSTAVPRDEEGGDTLWWSLILVIVVLSCLLVVGLVAIVCYLKRYVQYLENV